MFLEPKTTLKSFLVSSIMFSNHMDQPWPNSLTCFSAGAVASDKIVPFYFFCDYLPLSCTRVETLAPLVAVFPAPMQCRASPLARSNKVGNEIFEGFFRNGTFFAA